MKTKAVSIPRSFCCAAIIVATGALASAQLPTEPSMQQPARANADGAVPSANLSRSDRHFIEKAAEAGHEEIAISQVAVTRSTNAQVREFAQMMVSDHGQANTELSNLAVTKGVSIPMKEIDVSKWQNKDLSDFDKDYVAKMVEAHKDAVKLFTKEADKGDDAGLKTWAAKTLPALQTHLSKVETLKEIIK